MDFHAEESNKKIKLINCKLNEINAKLKEISKLSENIIDDVFISNSILQLNEKKFQLKSFKEKIELLITSIAVQRAKINELEFPIPDQIESSLKYLKPAHIAIFYNLKKPPDLVMRIMDCVLILFQKKVNLLDNKNSGLSFLYPAWNESLKQMSKSRLFLNNLKSYRTEKITNETVELLEPYFQMDDYNIKTANKVCTDLVGLLKWTKLMALYHNVKNEVADIKKRLTNEEVKLETNFTYAMNCFLLTNLQ